MSKSIVIKKRVGRPSVPEHLKAKPITKPVRVPVGIASVIKELADAYKAGNITADEIRALVEKGKDDE